ncbi:MAG: NAD-dependent epimerase/dehydratase family protein [Candidatus Omnitrophica bacterium]|nr:NAD-dependent epimerase/dehydratase family protein [Candidatus Omnitrophota bacterium]
MTLPKVLITGGAGFIGLHLARFLLEQGQEVTICDNLSRMAGEDEEFAELRRHPRLKWFQRDLTQISSWETLGEGYDFVYHLAAINGTSHFYTQPLQVLRVNLLTVLHLVDWASRARCGKILFASSSEVYASLTRVLPIPVPTDETVPGGVADFYNPRFSYAGSKMAGELLFIHSGLRMSIVRYHNVYGPRMGFEHVIPNFCTRLLQGEDPFPIFGTTYRRAFCYVSDAVRATQAVMENTKTDKQILNIGNDHEEIAMIDLARRLFEIAKRYPRIKDEPAPPGAVERRCPDITKLKQIVGFQPQVDLDRGLRQTWEWYRTRSRLQLKGVS